MFELMLIVLDLVLEVVLFVFLFLIIFDIFVVLELLSIELLSVVLE